MTAPSKEELSASYDSLNRTLEAFQARLVERYLVPAEVPLGTHGESVGFGKVDNSWMLYFAIGFPGRQPLLKSNIHLRRQAALKLGQLVDALETEQTKQFEAVQAADNHVAGEFARLVR